MRQEFIQYSKISNDEIICKEKGRTFHLHTNNASFAKVKIDGGVVAENTSELRCDYLIIKQKTEDIEIFVELKGNKITKAMEQLIASYDKYANKRPKTKHYACIVSSRYPQKDTSIQIAEAKLMKKFRQKPYIKNEKLEVKYNQAKNEIQRAN